ncbi:DUF6069 family protein [Cryptosporangium arvum]|uniref:DUF6069 family protein n=1 Tax=Cryptosporangium arvum TaxID=80871 RepID=UPI0004B46898|nr:DUF6069 family protein [Cryptosporangium arvum]
MTTTGAPAASRTSFVVTGLVASAVAASATGLAALLAQAVGVDFDVVDGQTIPVPGFVVVAGFFSLVGVLVAAAFRRWSARPAVLFVRTAVALTVVSLIPPLVSGAAAATVVALVVLHLVPAAVMIPVLARSLSGQGLRATAP